MSNYKKSLDEIEESLCRFQEKYQRKKIEDMYGIIGKFLIDEDEARSLDSKNQENNLY